MSPKQGGSIVESRTLFFMWDLDVPKHVMGTYGHASAWLYPHATFFRLSLLELTWMCNPAPCQVWQHCLIGEQLCWSASNLLVVCCVMVSRVSPLTSPAANSQILLAATTGAAAEYVAGDRDPGGEEHVGQQRGLGVPLRSYQVRAAGSFKLSSKVIM